MKKLTELIASFLDVPTIKQKYKGKLVGTVLNGYLALRRLVVQRTRIIDETQEKLLELLEEMTSGVLQFVYSNEKNIYMFMKHYLIVIIIIFRDRIRNKSIYDHLRRNS